MKNLTSKASHEVTGRGKIFLIERAQLQGFYGDFKPSSEPVLIDGKPYVITSFESAGGHSPVLGCITREYVEPKDSLDSSGL